MSPRESSPNAADAVVHVRMPPNVKVGAMIGDKYRVDQEIGRGGYGVVVRAIHLTLDQKVAIKVLTEGEGSTDAEFAEDAARFRLEAKATAALRSSHVVRVLDVDVLDDLYPYIVMEYLDGRTLHDLVYSQPSLSVEEVVDVMIQVLAALAEAHSVGIVHRDLKPANVFLTTNAFGPIAKVLDFGVSKMLGAGSQRLTRTGAVVGTVAYMAPEQMLDAKRVDGRADLWSVGLVLYESLTRQHPFGLAASGPKLVTAILKDPLVPLRTIRPDTPPELDAVVARLLDKSPERRYATAAEAATALAPFGSIRVRPVIDEIRRAPPPTGAAAPVPASVRTTDVRLSVPPAPAKPPSVFSGALVVLATAAIVVSIAAALLLYLKPRFLARTPRPAVTAPPPTVVVPAAR